MLNFKQSNLSPSLIQAVTELGYETFTPIQSAALPLLLDKKDLIALAQTGTGKTAAFALPILMQIDLKKRAPQALVIAPTREIAIQTAEAFKSYAKYLKGFNVAPIYGGQDFGQQLKAIKRGAQVIVATPGRLMDHLRRHTLKLEQLQTVILDEADEMLNMGFIEDIEWILSHRPPECQTALFSATMPIKVNKIAKKYLQDAEKIAIKPKPAEASLIEQSYLETDPKQKLDVLTRILAVEQSDGVIVFVRTKTAAAELATKLQARGYSAAALHGDMGQSMREAVMKQVKKKSVDILVATDVAARGIDISRMTHVINYDIPTDPESYTHRVGRTGRAGQTGRAILFVTRREKRLLREIQKNHTIEHCPPPTQAFVEEKKQQAFQEKVVNIIQRSQKIEQHKTTVDILLEKTQSDPKTLAAALLVLLTPKQPPAEKKKAEEKSHFRKKRLQNKSRDFSAKRRFKKKKPNN